MGVAGSSRGGGRGRGGGKPRRTTGASSTPSPQPQSRPKAPSRRPGDANGEVGGSGGVVKATIPSDYNAGRDLQERILEDVQRQGFSTDNAFAVRIALEEALVNAIKHGNASDASKKIHVEARVTAKRAEITIEDEGGGFDRQAIPDPTLEENLHKCSGRGIHLIEAYMDEVQWSRGGRRLKMVKENQG